MTDARPVLDLPDGLPPWLDAFIDKVCREPLTTC
jgi:hypothetical protein